MARRERLEEDGGVGGSGGEGTGMGVITEEDGGGIVTEVAASILALRRDCMKELLWKGIGYSTITLLNLGKLRHYVYHYIHN